MLKSIPIRTMAIGRTPSRGLHRQVTLLSWLGEAVQERGESIPLLDECILCRPSWPDQFELYAANVKPLTERRSRAVQTAAGFEDAPIRAATRRVDCERAPPAFRSLPAVRTRRSPLQLIVGCRRRIY